jgi:amidase
MLNIKGIHTTIGYVSFIQDDPSEINSYLVDILLSQGAVLYVKTNIPQTMMVSKRRITSSQDLIIFQDC